MNALDHYPVPFLLSSHVCFCSTTDRERQAFLDVLCGLEIGPLPQDLPQDSNWWRTSPHHHYVCCFQHLLGCTMEDTRSQTARLDSGMWQELSIRFPSLVLTNHRPISRTLIKTRWDPLSQTPFRRPAPLGPYTGVLLMPHNFPTVQRTSLTLLLTIVLGSLLSSTTMLLDL